MQDFLLMAPRGMWGPELQTSTQPQPSAAVSACLVLHSSNKHRSWHRHRNFCVSAVHAHVLRSGRVAFVVDGKAYDAKGREVGVVGGDTDSDMLRFTHTLIDCSDGPQLHRCDAGNVGMLGEMN